MLDDNFPKSDLPDPRYVSLCRRLVQRKSLVDAWLGNASPSSEIKDFVSNPPESWLKKWTDKPSQIILDVGPTVDPFMFLRTVLPFFDTAERTGQTEEDKNDLRRVDPSCVIGDSAGWLRERYDEEHKRRALVCCEMQVSNRLKTGQWNTYIGEDCNSDPHPQSMRVDPFGLYLAHEGKNRVEYYRERQLRMPTSIWFCRYISPENLVLLESSTGWEVEHKGHETRPIEYCADIVVPLLKAYGVRTLRKPEAERRTWLGWVVGDLFR